MFSVQKNQRTRGQNSFCPERMGWRVLGEWRRKVVQTMYTHVSKCKNDKRKKYCNPRTQEAEEGES
jgi:hypothetical protein